MSVENPLALVFPGQGTQRVGMADTLFSNNNPEARELVDRTFEEASDIVNLNLRSLAVKGPEEKLDKPGITEPVILTTSIAALGVLNLYGIRPDVVAGHSLGEYSALVAAGWLKFEHAVGLAKSRGDYMEETRLQYPEGMAMAAVLGLTLGEVEDICEKSGVEVANINSEKQIVISGESKSVDSFKKLLGKRRAKVIMIRVNIASHSSLMEPAKKEMEKLLQSVPIGDPNIPFIQNVTADYAKSADQVKRGLVDHITGRVLWLDTINLMSKDGVDEYIEVLPGEVLSKLIRRIDPSASVRSYEEELAKHQNL